MSAFVSGHWLGTCSSKAHVIFGIGMVLASGSQLPGQAEINNDFIIAAILAHDSQLRDIEVSFEENFEAEGDAPPRIHKGTWAHKANLHYYYSQWIGSSVSWENGYDGKEVRTLSKGPQSPWPQGFIKRNEPLFVRSSVNILCLAGRKPAGGDLAEAMETGKARVQPKPVKIDGHDCYVVEGNTITEDDRIFFRYWLDPQCGFMPRRTEDYAYDAEGSHTISQKIIRSEYQLSEVSPGIWMPVSMKVEVVRLKDGQWKRIAANNHWKATKVVVNAGMSDERLKVQFPPGTYVQDYPHPNSNEYVEYVIAADGSADPDGLDALVKLTQSALGEGQAQKGKYVSKGRAKWLVGCLVAGLGICGLVFARVRARSRSKEPRQHPGAR